MELVKTGNYIRDIESRHHDKISKLNFGKFNVWQIYRNFLIYRYLKGKNSSKRPPSKKTQSLIHFFFRMYQKKGALKNKHILYSTSAVYDEKKGNRLISTVLMSLAGEIGPDQVYVIATDKYNIEQHETFPNIEFNDLILNKKHSSPFICMFLFPVIFRHFRALKSFLDINFSKVAVRLADYFVQYWYYHIMLRILKPASLLFYRSSYGSEGLIAAARALNIKIYEYQHGQLYKEHYGYNFCRSLRGIKNKMILPDKLLLYGEYWKEVLKEEGFFDEHDMVVCGHPTLANAAKINLSMNSEPVAVFSSPYAAEKLIKFIDHYINNSDYAHDYEWLIKCHPRENKQLWQELVDKRQQVHISSESTYDLLNSVKIVLSASPSILYESSYFGNSVYCFFPNADLGNSQSWAFPEYNSIEDDFLERFEKNKQVAVSEKYYTGLTLQQVFS